MFLRKNAWANNKSLESSDESLIKYPHRCFQLISNVFGSNLRSHKQSRNMLDLDSWEQMYLWWQKAGAPRSFDDMMKFQQVGSRLLNRSGGLNTTTQRCHLHVAGLECRCTIMFPFRSLATVNKIFCAFHVDVVPTNTPVTILRVQDRHYARELSNSL